MLNMFCFLSNYLFIRIVLLLFLSLYYLVSSAILTFKPLLKNDLFLISSVAFNQLSHPSHWVHQVFSRGTNISFSNGNSSSIVSHCSMEMLGFQWIGRNVELPHIYTQTATLDITPAYNTSLIDYDISLLCHFRILQGTFRLHFLLAFYCPIIAINICRQLTEISQSNVDISRFDVNIKGSLFIKPRPRKRLSTSSLVNLTSIPQALLLFEKRKYLQNKLNTMENMHVSKKITNPFKNINKEMITHGNYLRIGICNVLPYRSSIKEKRAIYESILDDWIKYYAKLNITIFLYDRHGKYSGKFNNEMIQNSLFHYYNYSIGQYVIPSSFSSTADLKGFDNADKKVWTNRNVFNEDKIMTLTHCRYEARVNHGIQHMIVADSDEFLFCNDPKIPTLSFLQQHQFIQSILIMYSSNSIYDELSFLQRTPPSRNITGQIEGMLHCARQALLSNTSILECYASSQYRVDSHGHKTVYLGYSCPYTSYHEGCTWTGHKSAFQSRHGEFGMCQDCSRTIEINHCKFIHASFRPDTLSLERFLVHYKPTPEERHAVEASQLELTRLFRGT